MAALCRWGIIGPGSIARQFAAALRRTPGAELYGVASRERDKAVRFASEFGVPRVFDDYEDLASCPEIDLIYIATPHNFHHAQCLLCLNAGKGVLCEKPLCLNEAQAREVVTCARERKLFLMEAMWTRFFPAMERVRQLVREEAVGQIRLLTADFGFPAQCDPQSRLYNPALAGGGLLDVGVYPLSFVQMLWGEPRAVRSLAAMAPTGVDDLATWLLEYADGRIATGSCALSVRTPQEALLAGTRGMIRLRAPWWRPSALTIEAIGGEPRTEEFPCDGNGYDYETAAVTEAFRNGHTEHPLMPHADSLAVARMMDALRAEWGLRYPGE